jgi:hypothetical protein
MWVALGVAAAVALLAWMLKVYLRGHRGSTDVDVGNVSEAWLSEQRARKDR